MDMNYLIVALAIFYAIGTCLIWAFGYYVETRDGECDMDAEDPLFWFFVGAFWPVALLLVWVINYFTNRKN